MTDTTADTPTATKPKKTKKPTKAQRRASARKSLEAAAQTRHDAHDSMQALARIAVANGVKREDVRAICRMGTVELEDFLATGPLRQLNQDDR